MAERILLVKIDKASGGPQHLSFSEPIGICYISSYLKERGIESRVLHLTKDTVKDDLANQVRMYCPTVIGFSVRNFNFNSTCECIATIRNEFPDIMIYLGGECITWQNAIELAKKANADFVVVSDGEEAVFAFLSGQQPENIPGIAYRTSGGEFIRSTIPPQRIDPSTLPMMNREGLPMKDYSSEGFPGKKYATMHVQRGCRYKCTFCHTASRYDLPASRTHKQIMEEVEHLSIHHQIEALAIWDEDFFSDFDRVKQLTMALIDRGSPVQWHTYMKLTDLKNKKLRKLLPLLRESGYVRAVIGLESFIPKTLRYYHKAGGPNIEERLKHLSDQGITVTPSYIIGEPHETEKDIAYGLDHLLRLKDRGIQMDLPYITFITPFPGTPLYDQYSREGLILDQNWDHYDGENIIVKSLCPPDRLIELRDEFYRNFYGDN
ncbi:MAG: B12-binding domain-containing radical SAM protein [Desulfobacteraceae bacterium]|nr:B12-binding domain-containing radical SAM protein [Desulfobacteraceae bacterium]MBC2755195.1 B12-binding domain-containing radical SAM protein [Desulfobacteraceae bacterium]